MKEYHYKFGNLISFVIAKSRMDAIEKIRDNIGRRFVVRICKVVSI